MADINVTYQTQKIVVDPSTNSISVIQAGPQGPGGPIGEVSTAQLNTALDAKVDVAGDTMTGPLVLPNNTAALQAAKISWYNNLTGQFGIAGINVGDTGRRNLSSLLVNGWTGAVYIQRVGALVYMQLEALNAAAATNDAFLTEASIAGFGKTGNGVWLPIANSTRYLRIWAGNGGAVEVVSRGTGIFYSSFSWLTNDSWPASLPGTQVTAPFSL